MKRNGSTMGPMARQGQRPSWEEALLSVTGSRAFLLLVCLVFAIPVLDVPRFITLDGGAHAYNVHIIRSLLLKEDSIFADYFKLNSVPVPNWSGHALMAAFRCVLDPAWSEKLTWMIYFVLAPFGFRSLLVHHGAHPVKALLFVPLLQHYMLYLGFMNYCLGLAVFPWALLATERSIDRSSPRRLVLLSALLLLLYFSHLFPFLVAIIVLITRNVQIAMAHWRKGLRVFARNMVARTGPLILAVLPSMVPLAIYRNHRVHNTEPSYLDFPEQLGLFVNWSVLRVHGGPMEDSLVPLLGACFSLFIVVALVLAVRGGVDPGPGRPFAFASLSAGAVLLVLFFLLPDDDGSASYISARSFWFSILLLMFFAAIVVRSMKVVGPVLYTILLFGVLLVNDRTKRSWHYYHAYEKIVEARTAMPDHGHLIQVFEDQERNWIGGHITNYLAETGDVMLWDNYEANKGYFPVTWREESIPNVLLGTLDAETSCAHWKTDPGSSNELVADLVVLVTAEPPTACQLEITGSMKGLGYVNTFKNERALLFDSAPIP